MAYHRPLDAYEEYIARKRESEALTQEITLEIQTQRPPYLASKLALDEADLTLGQWALRILMGILCLPMLFGAVLFIPPKRENVLRRDLADAQRQSMSASGGGPIKVSPTAQPLQSS